MHYLMKAFTVAVMGTCILAAPVYADDSNVTNDNIVMTEGVEVGIAPDGSISDGTLIDDVNNAPVAEGEAVLAEAPTNIIYVAEPTEAKGPEVLDADAVKMGDKGVVEAKEDSAHDVEYNGSIEELIATESNASDISNEDTETESDASKAQAEAAEGSTLGTGEVLGTFKLTGYCSCSKCQGGWGLWTASGGKVTENRTVAVDRRAIPLGTWIDINLPGVGWRRYRAEDTGGGVKGNHIDIYVGNNHSDGFLPRYNGYAEVRLAK